MPSPKIEAICPVCNRVYKRRPHDIKRTNEKYGEWKCWICSRKERAKKQKNELGKITFHKSRNRYLISTEDGRIDEHRYVMEQYLGRELERGEVVHHMDGNPLNNNIENLELMSNGSHSKLHHTGSKRTGKTRNNISNALKDRNPRPIKLTEKEVREIRSWYSLGDYSYGTLAAMYNVSKGMVRNIVKYWSWRSV